MLVKIQRLLKNIIHQIHKWSHSNSVALIINQLIKIITITLDPQNKSINRDLAPCAY